MSRPIGRLAGHDRVTGEPFSDTEVLAADELAADYGWTPRQPERPVQIDPATVDHLAALQAAVRKAAS